MSDNIPFDIQVEIIKRVSNVKPLVRFRSVSKRWKSYIDSSKFIKSYGAHHTNPHSRILGLSLDSQDRFMYLVDDDNNSETFKVYEQDLAPFVMSPLLKQYVSRGVGACHGLLCLYGFHSGYKKWMLVIWNPSIGKSFGIAAPMTRDATHYGFGVCPVTNDPTVVKIKHRFGGMPSHGEVFTLSSRVWNVIPSSNMLCDSVRLSGRTQVVIDRFIYWGASDMTSANAKYIVASFDLITKEFKEVDLPNSLTNKLYEPVSVSKLRESLVVYVYGAECCGVWVMEHDSSFKMLFTIGARVDKILGFGKSGEAIFEIRESDDELVDDLYTTLNVYDPCSQQIKNHGISADYGSMFMGSYKESLLLLDHSDLHIYSEDS